MKINVASDLHLETYEWFPKFSPPEDLPHVPGSFLLRPFRSGGE